MAKDFVAVKILDLPGAGGGCACSSTPRGPDYCGNGRGASSGAPGRRVEL